MKDSQSPRAARRGPRMFTVSLLIFLLLALTTAVALPQEQAAEGPYPTDAEVAATLEPVVLSETRRGDMTTITLEIPVGADTFTTSNRPTTNWSNDPNMRIGFNIAQGNGAQRAFLFFPMDSIPSNATVTAANLRVFQNAFSPPADVNMGALARFLSSSWDASTLTWANFNPSWGAEIGIGQLPATTGWIQASITSSVQEWVSGTRPNFGIMVQGDETPQQRERVFTTINANNGLHPRIVVTYNVNVDTTPPTSSMTALPQWSTASFNVNWSGTDNPGGTGIRHFDVQMRQNGGNWQNWQTAVTNTSATFTGQNGILYEFRARAVDRANNVEAFPNNPQARTTVDTIPPTSSVNALPQYTFTRNFTVSWSGTDALSGIAHYDVQFQINGGPWQALTSVTTQASHTIADALVGAQYGFRVRAVDRAGNVQPFPGGAQAQTTISVGNPEAHIIPFTSPIATQNSFVVQWFGEPVPGSNITSYDLQFSFNNGPWRDWLTNLPGGNGANNRTFTAQDGDGVYAFRVRARDGVGRVGEFRGGLGATIAVDTVAPFITIQSYFPTIYGE
ncbi:MAG TPA: DNRLRE domain-containing protein [Promineifilum sp.]|nr:DNRLRE domain-containing protein [Promineifilum sp.]